MECLNGIQFSFGSFNPDPRVRNTFWTLTMGGAIALLPGWAVTQHFVQRYLAVKTLRDARRSGLNNIPRGLITAPHAHFMLVLFINQGLVV